MKLIRRTNRNFLIAILIVLPISCVVLFFSLRYFLSVEVDEKLRVDELRIVEQLKVNPEVVSIAPVIEVSTIETPDSVLEGIRNVVAYDPVEKENEPYRELVSAKKVNGIWYSIKIRHSIIEGKDFIISIGASMALVLLLTFVLLLFLNNRLSLSLWKPFYTNLDRLKSFSIAENKELNFEDSDVNEFQDLKISLILLTDKLKKDFVLLKEFTENASHEIQTPLSIVSINLEEVLQSNLNEETYKKLYTSYQSVQRLSKLNERMLLLAKIDNNQYNEIGIVDFNELITHKIEELSPLFKERELDVVTKNTGRFSVSIDPILASQLVVNLLTNAIKHNVSDSKIYITLSDSKFSISNETSVRIDERDIFERFKKGNNVANSTGLGLSIVQRIAEVSNLTIKVESSNKSFKIVVGKKD